MYTFKHAYTQCTQCIHKVLNGEGEHIAFAVYAGGNNTVDVWDNGKSCPDDDVKETIKELFLNEYLPTQTWYINWRK